MRQIPTALLAASLAAASPALAACPIELATYADTRGVAELEFTPGTSGATASNSDAADWARVALYTMAFRLRRS